MRYTTTIFAVTLLLVALLLQKTIACPTECYCTDDKMTCADVQFQALDLIALEVPPQIKEVVLSGNGLKTINENAMVNFRHLESLEISKNAITKISVGTFRGFSNLKKLVMNENNIVELEEGTFFGLRNLRHLEMKKNMIAHLKSGIFDEVPHLTFLRFDDNKLKTIGNGVFSTLKSLRRLYLTRNEIMTIQEKAFQHMKMHLLELSSNKIRVLPASAFEGFEVTKWILLLKDPLDCSCRQAMNFKVNFKHLKVLGFCASPYHVRSQNVMQAHKELLECTMCDLNPCHNQGECTGDKDSYTCKCQERFKGQQCQTDVCAGYRPPTTAPVVVVPVQPEHVAFRKNYKQVNSTQYVIVKEQIPNEDDQNKLKILYAMCAFEFIVIVCFVVYFMWKRYEEWKLQKRYESDKNRAILFSIGAKGNQNNTNNGGNAALLNQQQCQPLTKKVLVEENEEFPADLKHMILTGSVPV